MIGRIVHLSPDDDAASVRDRIEWANADRVALVLPDNGRPLQRELDFVLIQRAGEQCGAEVAIVSGRLRDRQLARQAGLAAFTRVEHATARRWLPPDALEPLERRAPPRRFQPRSLRRFYPRRNWLSIGLRVVIAAAALAVAAGAGLLLAPTGQITLTASSQAVSTILPVRLSLQASAPDLEAGVIPAQRIDVIVEDRFTTAATGAKDIPRYKAGGMVTFFNALASPYLVPKNTVVRTSSSSVAQRFVTLRDVEVPPGARADAPIQALEPGTASNVPANLINQVEGMPALAVRVINQGATSGGGYETVRAVTDNDYRRARVALRAQLAALALERIRQDPDVARNRLYVVPDTLFVADIQDETFDRFVTEQADEVTLNMRLQVAGLAVSPDDLNRAAEEALQAKVPPGFSLLSVAAARGDVAEEGTGPDVVYYIDARGTAGAEIDEWAVRQAVRGRTVADAQSTLLQELSLRGNPSITIGPDWMRGLYNRLPLITSRIQTTVRRE